MKTKRNFSKKERVLALIVGIIMIIASFPAVLYAAEPEVYIIEGERTVFVAAFGRMNYNGTTYYSYKSFNEAMAALGTEGGKIVITGEIDMSQFADMEGRKDIIVTGIGTKVTGNVLNFGEVTELNLLGNLTLDFVSISCVEGFVINTNGHTFTVSENYDSYYYIADHTTGQQIYSAFPSITVGSDTGHSAVSLDSGHFANIGVGGSEAVSGNSTIRISGGVHEAVYSGVADGFSSIVNGNIYTKISGGEFDKVYAGSASSGTVNGNVFLEITGGTFNSVAAGSEKAGGIINGNAVLSVKGVYISGVGQPNNSSVKGKIIYVSDRELGIEDGAYYDYYIVADGGIAEPVFEGTELLGFRFHDETGCISENVQLSGKQLTPVNGLFTLPEGKSKVTVVSEVKLELNRYANYVSGYDDGTFLPQNNLSRAEAIAMLTRLITDENTIKEKSFSSYEDVADGSWYEPYIGFLENLGYLDTIALDGGLNIGPNNKITRGEFSEVLRNILYIMNPRHFNEKEFSDVPLSYPYYDSVGELAYLGIITGYEDGTFRPNSELTRAEAVTMINRMLSRVPTGNAGGTVFSDAVGHWAETQILMAANPSVAGETEIWTIDGDITKGKYTLIEDENATLDQQFMKLYEMAPEASSLDMIDGIDTISNWQIDNIVNSESDYSTITGTKYYISPDGDDSNDGKSPETAWKSLSMTASGVLQAGDGVLFERGAIYRGKFNAKSGVTYSAYGEGEKPRIYGSVKNYADPDLWEIDGENIWKCTEIIREDVGVMIFDSSEQIGNYNEIAGRKIVGSNYKDGSCLKDDLQFFYNFGRLYLYSTENPGERFDSIEIGSNGSLVNITGNDIVIDNLHFRYHGGHVVGTGNKKNITSKNCIYAYTGGSVLSGTTLYGNAFESYGGCDGWYAYNNWMYQIYDTGVTHQYTPTTGKCVQKNIEYIGNVIEYCHWSIEYYNGDSTDGSERLVENVGMYNNICRMGGYGWGSRGRTGGATMFCSAGITKNTNNFIAKHNILDRCTGNILNIGSVGDLELQLEENIFVQRYNGYMGNLKSGGCYVDDKVVQNLAKSCVENVPVVVINDDTTIINNIKS